MPSRLRPSPISLGYYYDRDAGRTGEPLLYEGEGHILMLGLSGAGKSTRCLIENLVTLRNRSVIVFDINGSLAAQTARTRRKFGDVKILNPFGVLNLLSDGFNPLGHLDPDSGEFHGDAVALADAMIEVEIDAHWSTSAQVLLTALMMWEVIEARGEKREPSLSNVHRMLTEPTEIERYTARDGQPRQRAVKGLPATAARMVKQGGDVIARLAEPFVREDRLNELAAIQSTALVQTEWLMGAPMRDDLAKDGVTLAQLRERPTTIYVILPASQVTHMRRWTRLVVTAALRTLLEPGPVETLFVLDEFVAAIGRLKIIEEMWPPGRSIGNQFILTSKTVVQLQELFGDTWEIFAAQAGAVVTIGPPGDLIIAEWLSKRSGKTKAGCNSSSQSSGHNATTYTEGYSGARQPHGRAHSGIQGVSSGSNHNRTSYYSHGETTSLLPQEVMSMEEGIGRIWTRGAGATSVSFFAPNFWNRTELEGLVDPNPYYQGGGDSSVAAGTASFPVAEWPKRDGATYAGSTFDDKSIRVGSRYGFVAWEAAISFGAAATFWAIIVGIASATTHSLPYSLAAILGLALIPLAVSGGIRRRA